MLSVTARRVLLGLGLVLLVGGFVAGSVGRDVGASPETGASCGSVLAPTSFIVLDAGDPLVDEAVRCNAELAEARAPVWSALTAGGVLVVVSLVSMVGAPPSRRPSSGESGPIVLPS